MQLSVKLTIDDILECPNIFNIPILLMNGKVDKLVHVRASNKKKIRRLLPPNGKFNAARAAVIQIIGLKGT